jgi:hypothetical protein
VAAERSERTKASESAPEEADKYDAWRLNEECFFSIFFRFFVLTVSYVPEVAERKLPPVGSSDFKLGLAMYSSMGNK